MEAASKSASVSGLIPAKISGRVSYSSDEFGVGIALNKEKGQVGVGCGTIDKVVGPNISDACREGSR